MIGSVIWDRYWYFIHFRGSVDKGLKNCSQFIIMTCSWWILASPTSRETTSASTMTGARMRGLLTRALWSDGHIGAHSRRGDLETLGYNLVHWNSGFLPWRSTEDPEQVQTQKNGFLENINMFLKKCSSRRLLRGTPQVHNSNYWGVVASGPSHQESVREPEDVLARHPWPGEHHEERQQEYHGGWQQQPQSKVSS